MPNYLLQIMAEDYCCVQKFLEENVIGRPVEEAADALGVTPRTITNYRMRYRRKEIFACPKCKAARAEKDAGPKLPKGKVVFQYPGAKDD